jgi:hypothetical protein
MEGFGRLHRRRHINPLTGDHFSDPAQQPLNQNPPRPPAASTQGDTSPLLLQP